MEAKVYPNPTQSGYRVFFNKKYYYASSEEEAKEKAFELNYEFFSENKDRLPKGINIDMADKRFRLFIRLDNKNVKHIKSSKDLSLLIEIRKHIIMNLLDLL